MSTSGSHTDTTFENVPIGKLKVSSTNPRQHIEKDALKDLTASIKVKGILVPILVRPVGDGHMEIVAGERRYRAGIDAGLKEIPCMVRALTNDQALEAQVIENLQREDIHVLDEAEGFNQLVKRLDYSPLEIAAKIGKEEPYVRRRLALLHLIESAKKALYADAITIGHALLLCRLQPADQASAMKFLDQEVWVTRDGDGYDPSNKVKFKKPVNALEKWIHLNVLLDLEKAPFKKDDATLLPKAGACTVCPKRTGANKTFFGDITKDDRCTEPACFAAKLEAMMTQTEKALEEKHGKPVAKILTERWAEEKGAIARELYHEITGKACASASPAIVIDGTRRGQTTLVCVDPKCKVHFPTSKSRSSSSNDDWQKRQAAEKKRAQLNQKVSNAIFKAVVEKAPEVLTIAHLRQFVGERLIRGIYSDAAREICRALEITPPKDRYNGDNFEGGIRTYFKAIPDEKVPGFLLALVAGGSIHGGEYSDQSNLLNAAAKNVKVDRDAIRRRIVAENKPKKKKKKKKATKSPRRKAAK